MGIGKLAVTVTLYRPNGGVDWLPAGTIPEPADAALITNPAAWEGGKVPDLGYPGGVPSASWKTLEIAAWAAAHGVDVSAGKRKDDLLEIIRRYGPESGVGAGSDGSGD